MAEFDDPRLRRSLAAVYDDHHQHADRGRRWSSGWPGRDGRVLELAIGTGRVALPLASRGIAVEGVDASERCGPAAGKAGR